MLFCCSENPNLRINMSSVRLCKTKLLHVSVSSRCSDDVLVLSGTKNTWWRLKCFSRHDLDMIRLSEINNRVQLHTQSCECLRVWLCCVWSSLFSGPDGYWPASEPGLRCTDWIYCWASFSTFPLTCLETLEEFWIVFWPTDGSFQSRIRTFKTLEARWKHRAVFFSSVFGPLR